MNPFPLARPAFLTALAAVALGCTGDPRGRLPVRGAIRLHGAPLEQGSIQFLPTADDQHFATGAMIRDGEYTVPATHGLPPGTYRVLVTSPEPPAAGAPILPGSENVPVLKDRVPAEYNTGSRVTVEVKAGQDNRFDFDIK